MNAATRTASLLPFVLFWVSCQGPTRPATPDARDAAGDPSQDGFLLEPAAMTSDDGPLQALASGVQLVEPSSLGITAVPEPPNGSEAWRAFRCPWGDADSEAMLGIFAGNRLALDQDGDGDLREETLHGITGERPLALEIPAALAGESIPLRFTRVGSDRLDLHVPLVYRGVLEHGGESLPITAARLLPHLPLVMADADRDGTVDSGLAPGQVLALGGAAWTLDVDLRAKRARLVPSGIDPIAPGFAAPPLAGTTDQGDPFDLAEQPHSTALVFCSFGCSGCRTLMARLRALQEELGEEAVRVVQVVQGPSDCDRFNQAGGVGWPQLVAPAAWQRYQVVPTPTVVLVGEDGMVRFRGSGHDPRWMEMLREEVE